MSVGPVSGNGIAITLVPGKIVYWTVNVQASYTQFVQLKDSAGNIIFTATGPSAGGHAPTQIGNGTFSVNDQSGNYKVYIGINNGQSWSSVLWDDMILYLGSKLMCSNFNFISEDATDQDYNDSCLTMTWFNSVG
jgi:hypothetical protein